MLAQLAREIAQLLRQPRPRVVRVLALGSRSSATRSIFSAWRAAASRTCCCWAMTASWGFGTSVTGTRSSAATRAAVAGRRDNRGPEQGRGVARREASASRRWRRTNRSVSPASSRRPVGLGSSVVRRRPGRPSPGTRRPARGRSTRGRPVHPRRRPRARPHRAGAGHGRRPRATRGARRSGSPPRGADDVERDEPRRPSTAPARRRAPLRSRASHGERAVGSRAGGDAAGARPGAAASAGSSGPAISARGSGGTTGWPWVSRRLRPGAPTGSTSGGPPGLACRGEGASGGSATRTGRTAPGRRPRGPASVTTLFGQKASRATPNGGTSTARPERHGRHAGTPGATPPLPGSNAGTSWTDAGNCPAARSDEDHTVRARQSADSIEHQPPNDVSVPHRTSTWAMNGLR